MENGGRQAALRKNMIQTFWLWLLFGTGALAVMLYVAAHKTIVIASAGQEQPGVQYADAAGRGQETLEAGEKLPLKLLSQGTDTLRIPIPKEVRADAVMLENHYMDRELWIRLQGVEADFYEENGMEGDAGRILDAACEQAEDGVLLRLRMTGIYEYVSTIEENDLVLVCHAPGELYDRIVVVEPLGGGARAGVTWGEVEEKNVTLRVAQLLQQQPEPEGCRIYFARLTDTEVEEEECAKLAEEVGADLYVALGVSSEEEHPEKYGIGSAYNDTYFIPDFGNAQWADVLTRNVTIAASNRAVGIFPAEEDGSVLELLDMPAARISLGYLSNEQERQLLQQEEYLEKLAEGLANAIAEVYTR